MTSRNVCAGAVSAFLLWLLAVPASCASTNATEAGRQIVVDYFFEPGCEDCFRVSEEILPLLEDAFPDSVVLRKWDIGLETNYYRLVRHMDELGVSENAHVFMLVDGLEMLSGYDAIAADLMPVIEERLAQPRAQDHAPGPADSPGEAALMVRRMGQFTLPGILLGGLVDGVNPCAISTLVFLISVLSLSRARGRRFLLVGTAFCAASFITYAAIGFGLLRALHALTVFRRVQTAIDFVLIAIPCALSAFSFRDGFRYRRSRNPHDVVLQLPERVKATIHRVLRVGLGERAQVLTAFVVGALVTALESVCTGQVYVPTLALVVKSGQAVTHGLLYLVLYNVMFILPLVIVLLLTYRGLTMNSLIAWSRGNVFVSKILMGCFFLGLAALMIAL